MPPVSPEFNRRPCVPASSFQHPSGSCPCSLNHAPSRLLSSGSWMAALLLCTALICNCYALIRNSLPSTKSSPFLLSSGSFWPSSIFLIKGASVRVASVSNLACLHRLMSPRRVQNTLTFCVLWGAGPLRCVVTRVPHETRKSDRPVTAHRPPATC